MTNIDDGRPGMCAHCGKKYPTVWFLCPCPERAAADTKRHEEYYKKRHEEYCKKRHEEYLKKKEIKLVKEIKLAIDLLNKTDVHDKT